MQAKLRTQLSFTMTAWSATSAASRLQFSKSWGYFYVSHWARDIGKIQLLVNVASHLGLKKIELDFGELLETNRKKPNNLNYLKPS